jgi:DNA-directed RNA polymerase subunit RPC12/RpoP
MVELFGKRRYGCGSCGSAFKHRDELLTHAAELHNKKTTYLCITCDEEFRSESSFRMHMARDHKI